MNKTLEEKIRKALRPEFLRSMCENCKTRIGRRVRVNGEWKIFCMTCWRK